MGDTMPTFDRDELVALVDATEQAEYWAYGHHGDPFLPVSDGHVYLPGDYPAAFPGRPDVFWPQPPSDEEQEAIDAVRRLRTIRTKLEAAARAA